MAEIKCAKCGELYLGVCCPSCGTDWTTTTFPTLRCPNCQRVYVVGEDADMISMSTMGQRSKVTLSFSGTMQNCVTSSKHPAMVGVPKGSFSQRVQLIDESRAVAEAIRQSLMSRQTEYWYCAECKQNPPLEVPLSWRLTREPFEGVITETLRHFFQKVHSLISEPQEIAAKKADDWKIESNFHAGGSMYGRPKDGVSDEWYFNYHPKETDGGWLFSLSIADIASAAVGKKKVLRLWRCRNCSWRVDEPDADCQCSMPRYMPRYRSWTLTYSSL